MIGAGPKGIAIAAKARALAEAGLDAPRVVLIDRYGVAESWSGRRGHTKRRPPVHLAECALRHRDTLLAAQPTPR